MTNNKNNQYNSTTINIITTINYKYDNNYLLFFFFIDASSFLLLLLVFFLLVGFSVFQFLLGSFMHKSQFNKFGLRLYKVQKYIFTMCLPIKIFRWVNTCFCCNMNILRINVLIRFIVILIKWDFVLSYNTYLPNLSIQAGCDTRTILAEFNGSGYRMFPSRRLAAIPR